MSICHEVQGSRRLIGRLQCGSDLLDGLSRICVEENVKLGWVEALGAVSKARLTCYDQEAREYRSIEMDRELEITALVGNVSLKDGKAMLHAHVTLADETGRAYGGHLASGTIVFACEFIIQVFDAPILTRSFDVETGLQLWKERPLNLRDLGQSQGTPQTDMHPNHAHTANVFMQTREERSLF